MLFILGAFSAMRLYTDVEIGDVYLFPRFLRPAQPAACYRTPHTKTIYVKVEKIKTYFHQ